MNKTTLNVIQNTLQTQKRTVRANKTWQYLYDEYNIGTKVADGFWLSDEDLAYLNILYDKHAKTPIYVPKDTSNRMMTASHYVNEKWSAGGVFDEWLVFACPTVPLPTKSGRRVGGRGCVLAVAYDEIVYDDIDRLIVVENATLVMHCDDWYHLLPDEWQRSVFLYRGHGANARYVLDLVGQLKDSTQIAIYADFDLAGLDIVATFAKDRAVGVVLPRAYQTFDETHIDNQPVLFAKQNTHPREYQSPTLLALYRHICQHKLALTQENVLRLGELMIYEI